MINAHFFVANTINAGFLLQKWFEHICFVAKTIYTHFFVTKTIYAHFCHKKNLRILFFIAKTIFALFFVAKTISALRPESFCALKVASRKFQKLKDFSAPISSKKVTSLTVGPNWPFRWLDKSICIQSRAHISIFIFCSYQHLGLWLAWCEHWSYEKLCQVGGRPWHHRLSTAFHLYEVILEFWFGAFG